MPLTEIVEIWSSEPEPHQIGYAELRWAPHYDIPTLFYRGVYYNHRSLSATWSLRVPCGTWCRGPLLEAWSEFEQIRQRLTIVEREVIL